MVEVAIRRTRITTLAAIKAEANGQKTMIRRDLDPETGEATVSREPVDPRTPVFFTSSGAWIDACELAEMAAWAREEGPRVMEEMRVRNAERRGVSPHPTLKDYHEKLWEVAQRRIAEYEGRSVSGPFQSREVLGGSHRPA